MPATPRPDLTPLHAFVTQMQWRAATDELHAGDLLALRDVRAVLAEVLGEQRASGSRWSR